MTDQERSRGCRESTELSRIEIALDVNLLSQSENDVSGCVELLCTNPAWAAEGLVVLGVYWLRLT